MNHSKTPYARNRPQKPPQYIQDRCLLHEYKSNGEPILPLSQITSVTCCKPDEFGNCQGQGILHRFPIEEIIYRAELQKKREAQAKKKIIIHVFEDPIAEQIFNIEIEQEPLEMDDKKTIIKQEPLEMDDKKTIIKQEPLEMDDKKTIIKQEPLEMDDKKIIKKIKKEEQP